MISIAGSRRLLLGTSLALGLLSACSPGVPGADEGNGGTGSTGADGGSAPTTVKQADGIVCTSTVMLNGMMSDLQTPPSDVDPNDDCWPGGTWNFSAQIAQSDCTMKPQLAAGYKFKVTVNTDDNTYSYSYLNDPNYSRVIMKVSAGGGALCNGSLELYSPNGKAVLNMKAALHPQGVIDGQGEYNIYSTDQWP